jgi:hypothetical protein
MVRRGTDSHILVIGTTKLLAISFMFLPIFSPGKDIRNPLHWKLCEHKGQAETRKEEEVPILAGNRTLVVQPTHPVTLRTELYCK